MKTLNDFLTEKGIEMSAFEAMTGDEQAKLYVEYNTALKESYKALETRVGDSATKEELEAMRSEMAKAKEEQVEHLNATLKTMGLAIKNANDVSKDDVSLTSKESLSKGLEEKAEELKAMSETGQGKVTMKVVGDMTIIGNVSGGNVPVEQREAGVNNIARRRTFIRELISNGVATSNLISWVEQTGVEGAPAGTVEGTLKNQIDFDLVVVSSAVKKRTAFIKVSTEMLGDIDFMRSEINNELTQRLSLDIDDQILNGNNAGQNLNGIIPQSTAWAAGAFALSVVDPNIADVLTVADNQIEVANHMASVYVVHPTDMTALRLAKSTDAQYVDRLQDVAGQMSLDGIPVVKNTGIAQDTFLAMDGSKASVFSRGEMTIQVGLDSDDFTKNMRTVLIEWRGLNRIKGNDTTAFVTGTVSTSITALLKP
jgi:HK97 family phage major capsid protein